MDLVKWKRENFCLDGFDNTRFNCGGFGFCILLSRLQSLCC